ncbi:glycosyltransferase [Teredinibacter haidensis]|uniref:glycosyltransferase n=1 Tax=Teredinibacter haidensis TaxID=2731755 RepID=UPI000948EDFE|nr:glycosyltransferase [Teredinibacter haidensis]
MKVAIVHYWLVNARGGEKVLEAICELFPHADIYTHVYYPDPFLKSVISKHRIFETFIARLPFARKLYQNYLPLMPLALEELDLTGYDLILSSESGPAKGVIPPPGVPHICYCHSPMRYAWDFYPIYKRRAGFVKRLLMPFLMHYLRRWDQQTATQVTQFVANSKFVQKRIRSFYARDSLVVNPPVAFSDFAISPVVGDYYLLLGQLADYKRADLAVQAFNLSGKKLVVVGDGEQFSHLRKMANANVDIRGKLPFSEIRELLSECRALVFPGVEDFGIVPLEAMACGRPVIAYRKGGALETIRENITGLFFDEQTIDSLNFAVDEFEVRQSEFNSNEIRMHAERFGEERFKTEFSAVVDKVLLESS